MPDIIGMTSYTMYYQYVLSICIINMYYQYVLYNVYNKLYIYYFYIKKLKHQNE